MTVNAVEHEIADRTSRVRSLCRWCQGGSSKAVDECASVLCPIYPYRMGSNRSIADREEQAETSREFDPIVWKEELISDTPVNPSEKPANWVTHAIRCNLPHKAILVQTNRRLAMRLFCVECVGFESAEVKRCSGHDCPLYPDRQKTTLSLIPEVAIEQGLENYRAQEEAVEDDPIPIPTSKGEGDSQAY